MLGHFYFNTNYLLIISIRKYECGYELKNGDIFKTRAIQNFIWSYLKLFEVFFIKEFLNFILTIKSWFYVKGCVPVISS